MIDVRPVDGPEVIKVEPTASRDMGPVQIVFEAAVRCRAHAEQSALGGPLSMGSSAISAFLGRGRRRPA
jgi:hypothetical protein